MQAQNYMHIGEVMQDLRRNYKRMKRSNFIIKTGSV